MFQILAIDNDISILRYYKTILTCSGYHVFTAFSVQEALQIMDTSQIDLILLEPELPETNGFVFTQMLRECNNDVLILMVSNLHTASDIKQAFLAGTDDYMSKPVNEEEMILRIRALLRRARTFSNHLLYIGNTSLNYNTFTVTANSKEEILPQKNSFCYTSCFPTRPNRRAGRRPQKQ